MRPIVTLCALCVCLLDIAMSCAKTDEPIDMLLFGMWTRVEPRNHGLDGGRDPSGERTVFWGRWWSMLPFVKILWPLAVGVLTALSWSFALLLSPCWCFYQVARTQADADDDEELRNELSRDFCCPCYYQGWVRPATPLLLFLVSSRTVAKKRDAARSSPPIVACEFP